MTKFSTIYAQLTEDGTLQSDPAQLAVMDKFDRIQQALNTPAKTGWFRKAPEAPKGLYLWGGVGRGKSMLMDLFVKHLGDVPARRVHFHAFMQEIHAALHEAHQNGVEDAVAPVAKKVAESVRLLAFDEMQITDITDAMIVGRLFRALFEAGTCVITTSNRHPDELYKNGLNRQLFLPAIDLIKDKMVVHEMVSPRDYRQDRLAGEERFFTPISEETRATMDAVWRDLTGGEAEPLVLKIKGREVELPAYAASRWGRATIW